MLNGFTVYSDAVLAASAASATVVVVAAVKPMLNMLLRTVKNLDTEEAVFFFFEPLDFGIAQSDARSFG